MPDSTPEAGAANPPLNRRRLRSHLIGKGIRFRLVVDDMVFALLAALTAIGILYTLSNREIGDNLYSAHLSIKQTQELLRNGVKVAGVVTFLAVLLFGLWSMMDAHRLVGPLHRLLRLLTQIGDGQLTHEVRFRRSDEFQEVAAAADRLVDVYAERLAGIRRQADALERSLAQDALTAEQTRALRRQAAELNAALTFFQLPGDGAKPTVDEAPLS